MRLDWLANWRSGKVAGFSWKAARRAWQAARKRKQDSRFPTETQILEERCLMTAPSFGSSPSFSIAEDAILGSMAGSVVASDPDGDIYGYWLSGDTGPFGIDAFGNIVLNGSLDFESQPSFTFDAGVYDSDVNDGSWDMAMTSVTISVMNVAEAPSFTASSFAFSVSEAAVAGTAVGTLTATDPQNDISGFWISSGEGPFSIDGSGSLTLSGSLDFESVSSYTLTVHVSDMGGEGPDTATVTITVTDVEEDPDLSTEPDLPDWPATDDPLELAFQTQVNVLTTTQQTSVSSLRAALNDTVAGANAVYDASLQVAQTQLTTDLSSYMGNPLMFSLEEFVWPDAPASEAFEIPTDAEQPVPPGTRPTYDGPIYDVTLEPAYGSALTAITANHSLATSAAESAFNTAVSDATSARGTAALNATNQYNADLAAAQQALDTYVNTPSPIDIGAASQAYGTAMQAAQEAYNAAIEARSVTTASAISAAMQQFYTDETAAIAAADATYDATLSAALAALPPDATYEEYASAYHSAEVARSISLATGMAAANLTFTTATATLTANKTKDDAEDLKNLETFQHSLSAGYQGTLLSYESWGERRTIEGLRDWKLAQAAATRDLAIAQANGDYVQAVSVAAATHDRKNDLASANANQWNDTAVLQENLMLAWSATEGTDWANYQTTLATLERNYVSDFTLAYLPYITAKANAEQGEAFDRAWNAKTLAIANANNAYTRATATIVADAAIQLAEFNERMTVRGTGEVKYAAMLDAHSVAELEKRRADADSAKDAAIESTVASNNHLIAVANANLLSDPVAYNAAIAAADIALRDELADVVYRHKLAEADAENNAVYGRVEANLQYRKAMHALQETARTNLANTFETVEQGRANSLHAADVGDAGAVATAARANAGAKEVRVTAIVNARQTYWDSTDLAESTWTVAAATADNAFVSGAAAADATLLTLWDVTENTRWSEYQADLATSRSQFATDYGNAQLADTTRRATADLAWNQGSNALETANAASSAAARGTRESEAADHQETLAIARADKARDLALDMARYTKDYDIQYAQGEKALEDAVALEDATQQHKNHAEFKTYHGAAAASERDMNKTIIDQATHFSNLNTASALMFSQAQIAMVTRMAAVAAAQVSWTSSSNGQYASWNGNVSSALTTFRSGVRTAMETFASDEQASDNALATALATGEQTRITGYLPLDNTYATDLANSDSLWAGDSNDALNDYRENLSDNWGEYEEGVYADHAAAQAATFASTSDALDGYQAAYAAAEQQLAIAVRADRDNLQADITAANNTLTTAETASRMADVATANLMNTTVTTMRASQAFANTQAVNNAYTQITYDRNMADAARFSDDFSAEVDYFTGVVSYRNTNRLDQANANATWANTVASSLTTNWDILSLSNLPAIDAARSASIRATNLTRIDDAGSTNDVAGEMDQRASAQGDSLINQRTSYGGAQVTLATTLDGVEDSDDAVSQSLAAMSRSMEMSQWSNGLIGDATRQQTWTSSVGQHQVDFVSDIRSDLSTAASTIASAEAAYHVAVATAAAGQAAADALSLGTPEAQWAADVASAYVGWLNQMTPAFTAFVSATTTADIDAAEDEAKAIRDFDNSAASAELAYVTTWTGDVTTLVNSSASADDGLQNGLREASQAQRLSGANTGQQHGIDGATADKQHRRDRASALTEFEKGWQNSSIPVPFYELDNAPNAARATGVRNADKTWRYSTAAADKTYAYASAAALKAQAVAAANAEHAFAVAQDAANAAYDAAVESAQQTYGSGLLSADMARATALGSAQADWLDAIYSADVTAMTTLDTAWGIDFTQHHVDLATAKQTWWSGFRSNFLSYVSDVTNEWQTEQTSANLAWGTYSSALGAAESARTTAENDAIRDARVHVATAYEVREQSLADATEVLQQGWADAEAGQTGLHGLATAAFGAAVLEPSARFDVVSAATEFWLASQFHDAETAYAAAVAPAYQTYLTATSDAARTRRVNEANRTSAFEQLWASDFSAALGTFALTHPSPWATFAAAQANAEAVRVGSIAPAQATTESGLAQADHDFLTGLAGELATWLVASTDREQWQSLSEAEARLGAVLASADDLFASSGGTITGASLASTPSGSGVPSGFGSVWSSGPYSGSSTIGGTWTGSSSLLTTITPPIMLAAPYTPPADTSALPNNFVENLSGNGSGRSQMERGYVGSSAVSNGLFYNRLLNAVYGDDDTPNPVPLPRDFVANLAHTPLGPNNLKNGQTANEATGKVPEQVDEVLRIHGGAGDDVIAAPPSDPSSRWIEADPLPGGKYALFDKSGDIPGFDGFIGHYDPNTGKVDRNGIQVKLSDVEAEAGSPTHDHTSAGWAAWFAKHKTTHDVGAAPTGPGLKYGDLTVANGSGMTQAASLALLGPLVFQMFADVAKGLALQYGAAPAVKVILNAGGATISLGNKAVKLGRKEWEALARKLGKSADDAAGVSQKLDGVLTQMRQIRQLDLDPSSARELLKKNMGIPEIPGTGGIRGIAGKQAHHLIPLEMIKRHRALLEKASQGGFDINGELNGMLLDRKDHNGSHPLYSKFVSGVLETISNQLTPEETANELRRLSDTLRDLIRKRKLLPDS